MRTIETTAIVEANGTLTVQVPSEVAPGEHQVVVVIEDMARPVPEQPHPPFSVIHVGSWPATLSLRRKDRKEKTRWQTWRCGNARPDNHIAGSSGRVYSSIWDTFSTGHASAKGARHETIWGDRFPRKQ
jgi:hypothetical protein